MPFRGQKREASLPAIETAKRTQFYRLATFAIMLALLYFGKPVLMPLALAVLIAFLLAPVVSALERLKLGRVLSTVLVAVAALVVVVGFGWIVEQRFAEIVAKLPEYRQSMQAKFQHFGRSGMLEKVSQELNQTVQDVSTTRESASGVSATNETQHGSANVKTSSAKTAPTALAPPSPDAPWAVRLFPQPATALELFGEYVGKLVDPLATGGLVVVFVVFILVGRENLRDRMILLAGSGRLHVTMQAFDDAAIRISRFLTAQSLINASYGVVITFGLWLIDRTIGQGLGGGLRTALLAGIICAVMRYVPYIGPWLGAAVPLFLAFAAYPGNTVFFVTLAMFVGLEIFVSQAVEPNLLGSSTGISPIAVLVAAVFWTWLWGPIGLILSTPLTVLLVVMGKHVPQLEVLDLLLGDKPVLNPTTRIYQRLIAGDDEEAAEFAAEYLKERPLDAVYDQILIPALAQAESDWHRGVLDDSRHLRIRQGLKEIVQVLGEKDLSEKVQLAHSEVTAEANGVTDGSEQSVAPVIPRAKLPEGASVKVKCLPAHDEADQIVATMVAQILERRGFTVTVLDAKSLASEMVASLEPHMTDVVVISALPPQAALHARYLMKIIAARREEMKVVVCLWTNNRNQSGPTEFADVQIATSLDTLQSQLDQLTPEILLPKKGTAAGAVPMPSG